MGLVTDIQRFSLKDGPGIRTTIFLKGCNASCKWCHNPETLTLSMELLIYPIRCARCGACVDFDPQKALGGLPPPREVLNLQSASRCFSGALSAAGKEMSAAQVLDEVLQDTDYYRDSGGGITISGGEALVQDEFCGEILSACKERGIATAVETNLAYEFERLERLLPFLDMVMADIKLMDPQKHREYVGIDNAQVLENAGKLGALGFPRILRTPVIPGINDRVEEISRIAAFAAKKPAGLLYYELLNFNPLGDPKYNALNVENPFKDTRPLDDEAMGALAAAAGKAGIAVKTS
ncbi:MAG: glycyl-radical enzyme activating protein [Treponema sp.]|jgi:pyruvate formate lyase activating enzyme|nr:glycyl-radical enzyme activating protein [Treponema sp.]